MKKLGVLVVISTLFLTGCQTKSATVSDISESAITLPIVHSGEVAQYSRIVALANGSAEVVAALGYGNQLVGRDVASTIPELSNVPIDNPGHSISTELVLSQRPDLIIIDANSSPATAIATLKSSGVKVVTIKDSFDVAGILKKDAAIGALLGVPRASSALQKLITALNYSKSPTKVLFLYLRGTASIYLIGGKGSGADSLITTMGFRDLGSENLKQPFSAMTAEELVKLNPDLILLMSKGLQSVGGLSGLTSLPGVAQTRAGKEGRVVTVDDSLLLSFGPRTPGMMELLRKNILKAMA